VVVDQYDGRVFDDYQEANEFAQSIGYPTLMGLAERAVLSGALDLAMIGANAWPAGVPAQIHYTLADPFRNQAWIDTIAALVRSAGASIEVFDYPGAGHLFTDPSLPTEYDASAAELLWSRVMPFCAAPQ